MLNRSKIKNWVVDKKEQLYKNYLKKFCMTFKDKELKFSSSDLFKVLSLSHLI